MSCHFKYTKETNLSIPRTAENNNKIYYEVKIVIKDVEWSVLRRYREFYDFHEKLTHSEGHVIAKSLLPPKKILGNKNPEFVEQRRKLLEEYIQSLLGLFNDKLPRAFIEFLEFNKYDIVYLLQDLSHYFCEFGDSLLLTSKEYNLSSLELHCISERLCIPCPEADQKDKYDFSHVLDFCSQLDIVSVTPLHAHEATEGCYYNAVDVPIGKSNLIPKNLKFNMNAFRNIKELKFYGLSTENISDAYFLKTSLVKFYVHNTTIRQINQVLLCDSVHKDVPNASDCNVWDKLQHLDFTGNLITSLDESIKLASKVKTLILDKNRLKSIQCLSSLSNLETLSLAVNLISECLDWHLQLGNLKTLNLSQNRISTLSGLRKLYSLVNLDLSCNQIENLEEIDHIASLPLLENLKLTANPLAGSVDYRPRVLARFYDRAPEIILDNEHATGMDLDMALVLSALNKAKINVNSIS
ncbi:nischarin [Condylostylus longicornis]|uniref:nischarin n=1 Tax=Condylostylus longicornis TaxID=2530218 RepID=UPI00244E0653|nr:nischarin [Condylostylus longicornis]